ncbi:MAG: hypothetical protein K8U57_14790 [Planctomycetes bacterium]|nr:hypothetical protein [Planctomycetota bacterium]
MFRHLSVIVILAGSNDAEGSMTSMHQRDADRGMRTVAKAVWQTVPTMPHPPYRMTPDTEVLLDSRPADYSSITEGAQIEAMEVTPEGLILKVRFRTQAGRPPLRDPR